VNHYRFVVVDASSRLDQTTRLLSDLSSAVLVVAQTDVVSLWSAGRIHTFLEEGTGRDRLRVVLNRYKKIPGFTDEDVEQVTNCKVLWKVPNAYHMISPSIDNGTPIVLQEGPEISRSYRRSRVWRRTFHQEVPRKSQPVTGPRRPVKQPRASSTGQTSTPSISD
jgi:septum formation inhibitor-activating ATPase MinD